ncbi:hypothetical protein [Clostridium culturomicium]|uniref:hypothetical protein n=1 Tax=Clostridium culturomicium TaxID=1499683 RepID=UPI00058B6E0C|nr:hypothetical protein [Clostridium culturomicium]
MLKKFLSIMLSLSLFLAMFNFNAYALNTYEGLADNNITKPKTNVFLNSGNYEGKRYTTRADVDENNSIVAIEVSVRGEVNPVRVEFDSNTGIITSNGKVVGEISTTVEPINEMISPYATDTGFPGGGGQKILVKQSSTRIDSKDWEVIVAIVEYLAQEGTLAAATLLGISGGPAAIIALATSSFIKYVMNSNTKNVTAYSKTFYTGQVIKQNRFYYHRYLLEFYQNSNYTGYLGCEWSDSIVRR